MEHLSLEIFDLDGKGGSKYATLPDNTSIQLTDTSEIFASGDVWSHSFILNVFANAHIFGTAGDMRGGRLHEQIHKRRARLWVEGLPLYLGYLKLDDDVEVSANGDVDVSFESGKKTFDEMIEGMSARDVSVGNVMIGVALNRKRHVHMSSFRMRYKIDENAAFPEKEHYDAPSAGDRTFHVDAKDVYITQRWPKLVKSKGVMLNKATGLHEDINCVNVQDPYDDSHPYCNINICYQKKIKKNDEEVTLREYTVRLASGKYTTDGGDNEVRYNNAPNFYLLYWVKRLMQDLGIYITENQALDVEDLRRVFMANVGCFYEEKDDNIDKLENYEVGSEDYLKYGLYEFDLTSFAPMCKVYPGDDDRGSVLMRNGTETIIDSGGHVFVEKYSQAAGNVTKIDGLQVNIDSSTGYRAFATSDNYPNVNASDIIDAMEAAFGIRFLFSNDYSRVRIVLLRKVFNDAETQKINCDILSETKVENGIRGFRMTYNGDEDDTNYNYDDWKGAITYVGYDTIRRNYVTAFNKNCYINLVTGNAYRIKIDEDEKVFFPALFEVAGYVDAEDGDCTGDEGSIETVGVGAKPMLMNEVNGKYAFFVSQGMKPAGEAIEIAAQIPVSSTQYKHEWTDGAGKHVLTGDLDIYIKEGYVAKLQDSYDLSGDGESPLDQADLGLCFGVMRGSGSEAYIKYDDDNIENEGNEYWEVEPGSGAIDYPDTCDHYGNQWDYNTGSGIGPTNGRFSLKLRAEKPNPDYIASDSDSSSSGDGKQTITKTETYESQLVETKAEAEEVIRRVFTSSTSDILNRAIQQGSFLRRYGWTEAKGDDWQLFTVLYRPSPYYPQYQLLVTPTSYTGGIRQPGGLDQYFEELITAVMGSYDPYTNPEWYIRTVIDLDASEERLILDVNSTPGRKDMLDGLSAIWYSDYNGGIIKPYTLPAGISITKTREVTYTIDTASPEAAISISALRGRGLCDQFYKEYSFWIRNARVCKRSVRMELAQLLTIDKTKKVTIGDITGFIRKMQYSVNKNTGLGEVTIEMMYI